MFRGLMTASVALSGYDVKTRTACENAIGDLNKFTGSHSFITRAVLNALQAVVPGNRTAKIEVVRRALQTSYDVMRNAALGPVEGRPEYYFDTWSAAEDDVANLLKGNGLPPPLPAEIAKSKDWQRLERLLVEFDPSWKIWVHWLRFKVFGLITDDIPYQVWPLVERALVARPNEFWRQSEMAINAAFAQEVVEAIETLLEEEAAKDQHACGLKFYVQDNGQIDLLEQPPTPSDDLRLSVIREVIDSATSLRDLCDSNSTAHLRDRVDQYLDVMQDGQWRDGMLLVMRGDNLRKELAFQEKREEDSDIAPVTQAALMSLQQTVRMHNMMVNSHPALARMDRMLLGPNSSIERVGIPELRKLIASAESRHLVTLKAKEALDDAANEAQEKIRELDRQTLRASITVSNFLRATFSFLWKNRKKTALVGGTYALGHWAVANEAMITAYFAQNPIMRLLVSRVFEFLRLLPLA